MGFRDTPYFNARKYTAKCRKVTHGSILACKHNEKIRSMSAAFVSGTGSLAFVVASSGVSLIGAAYSVRQFHILLQQAHIIEFVCREKGFTLPELRVKDVIIGALIGAGALIAGWGIGQGLDHLAHATVNQLTTTMHDLYLQQMGHTASEGSIGTAGHLANHASAATPIFDHFHQSVFEADATIHHLTSALHGVGRGMHEALGAHHVASTAAANVQPDCLEPIAANIAGQLLTIHGIQAAGKVAVGQFVSYASEALAKRRDRKMGKNRASKDSRKEAGKDSGEMDDLIVEIILTSRNESKIPKRGVRFWKRLQKRRTGIQDEDL